MARSDETLGGYVGAMSRLFPAAAPESASWTESAAIRRVLGEFAVGGCTAVSAPDGRQGALRAVSAGDEPGTLEVATDEARYLVRPLRLALESFEGHTLTYLRLATQELGVAGDAVHLALAEHRRVRVAPGAAFVFCAAASPLVRTTDRDFASWDPARLSEFVASLQETMLAETG